MLDITALSTIGVVLAYAVFKWGGVPRTDQYRYLLVLGLLAVVLSLARPRHQWAPLPGRAVRWTLALLPAYILNAGGAAAGVPGARAVTRPHRGDASSSTHRTPSQLCTPERFTHRNFSIFPARLRISDHLPAGARADLAICG